MVDHLVVDAATRRDLPLPPAPLLLLITISTLILLLNGQGPPSFIQPGCLDVFLLFICMTLSSINEASSLLAVAVKGGIKGEAFDSFRFVREFSFSFVRP